MEPNSVNAYRTAKQAQDARYEDVTGLSVLDVDRQEYLDYFGIGDHAGRPVEPRLIYSAWMRMQILEREPESAVSMEQAFYLSGRDLAELASGTDWATGEVARAEIIRRAANRAKRAAA